MPIFKYSTPVITVVPIPPFEIVHAATATIGDAFSVTVAIPAQPDTTYKVIGTLYSTGPSTQDSDLTFVIRLKTTNSFTIELQEASPHVNQLFFDYTIVRTNA